MKKHLLEIRWNEVTHRFGFNERSKFVKFKMFDNDKLAKTGNSGLKIT